MNHHWYRLALFGAMTMGLWLAAAAQNPCNDPEAECTPVISQFMHWEDCNNASSTICCTVKKYRYKCSGDTEWRYITHKYAEQDSECMGDVEGSPPPNGDGKKDCMPFDEPEEPGG